MKRFTQGSFLSHPEMEVIPTLTIPFYSSAFLIYFMSLLFSKV